MSTVVELDPIDGDQWFLESPYLKGFIETVRRVRTQHLGHPQHILSELEPVFVELLAQPDLLPADPFLNPNPNSGMGGGIGQWLIFRSGDQSLSLFSLVVPAGSSTPVHDHLAWGLIGLYRGNQQETVYHQTPFPAIAEVDHAHHAHLEVSVIRSLQPGDIYKLIPPTGDIHAVKTTSEIASVSIHLLGNDTGCVWRHQYNPEAQTVKAFRSGYSNAPCPDEEQSKSLTP